MSEITNRQVKTHTTVAGIVVLLAALLWIVCAATRSHWVPEYAECARLGSVALILSALAWTAIAWLSRLLD